VGHGQSSEDGKVRRWMFKKAQILFGRYSARPSRFTAKRLLVMREKTHGAGRSRLSQFEKFHYI